MESKVVTGGGQSQLYQRTLPLLNDENRFFWTSGSEGVLRVLRCQACGVWRHPPSPVCSACLSGRLVAQAVSGEGEVFSFTLNMKAWAPGLEVPFAIAIVRLDEQADLKLTSNLVGVAPDEVHIGMRVRVTFEQDEDAWLPMFRPDLDSAAEARVG